MPKRFRPSRRPPIAMTEDGGRRQKRLTANAGLDAGQALFPLDPEARKAWAQRRPCGGIWVFVPKRNHGCAPTRPRGPV